MVAGGADMDAAAPTRSCSQVRRLAVDARRVTSVCSGAFVLAAAGLLDGRRATTHWAECGLLADTYAESPSTPTPSTSSDGNVWTSAGVTAGIDLALALVADDHGQQAAATVARQLVVYLHRSGGQAQFSALLAAQAADSEPVRDLLAWLPDHLTEDLSVAALARQVNLSERQFSRVFRAEVGATAADHVEAVRLESACRLLETTAEPIEQIAKTCGFGTPETMNRTFRRRLDTTPANIATISRAAQPSRASQRELSTCKKKTFRQRVDVPSSGAVHSWSGTSQGSRWMRGSGAVPTSATDYRSPTHQRRAGPRPSPRPRPRSALSARGTSDHRLSSMRTGSGRPADVVRSRHEERVADAQAGSVRRGGKATVNGTSAGLRGPPLPG